MGELNPLCSCSHIHPACPLRQLPGTNRCHSPGPVHCPIPVAHRPHSTKPAPSPYRQLTLTHLLPMLRGGGDSPTLSAQVPSIQQGTLPAARTGGSPPNQASTVQSKVNQAPPRIYPSDGAPTHHIRDPPSPCSPGCGHPPYPQAKHSTHENKLGRRSGWERVACRVIRSTR